MSMNVIGGTNTMTVVSVVVQVRYIINGSQAADGSTGWANA
jgi:hypothetical protein